MKKRIIEKRTGLKQVGAYLDREQVSALDAKARGNRRSRAAEIAAAVEAHLAGGAQCNANLIAAAPDMLHALTAACDNGGAMSNAMLAAARSAIAKAKGRAQ